eukprot:TRINITY_DN76594_c0_g1_i1.p1 TRINITY_DN76594_c0_g1~~TRINITY_DN76594_c0_g1_i1.p1  ORF type:complete len:477 (-),score=107.96 TRINITY_DN76594_c0_g1_i1:69-1433(-)
MFDPFSSWTVTEEKRKPGSIHMPRKGHLTKSSSAAALLKSQRPPQPSGRELSSLGKGRISSRGSTAGSRCSSVGSSSPTECAASDCGARDGGYAAFKSRFQKDYAQQRTATYMALPRRQRLVAETLQVVRDSWDLTDDRLADAARAEAEALARLMRTPAEQMASCCSLAQPRASPESSEEAPSEAPRRTWSEQQDYLRELAEPKAALEVNTWEVPAGPARSASEQQRRCAQLAQPRAAQPGEEHAGAVTAWREELAARASSLVPEEVQAARSLLERMKRDRPRSAGLRAQKTVPKDAEGGNSESDAVVAVQLRELKAVVEEVLWVSLLQVRSCPKASVPSGAAASTASSQAGSLEERLGSLLISTIGPALRPVARRILGPGQGLARRIRAEFPRLARHLGFRESEDPEPPVSSWKEEELSGHLAKVRESRDALLDMDFTKDAVSRLGEVAVVAP